MSKNKILYESKIKDILLNLKQVFTEYLKNEIKVIYLK